MSRTLAGLLREFNVEVVDNKFSRSRAARQTCAGGTLARIFELRGYEHMRSVIMSICETRNNKRMLVAPVIWAVSDVLNFRPDWLGDRWFKALDEIELATLYERAKALRRVVHPRRIMAITLIAEMERRFEQQLQPELI